MSIMRDFLSTVCSICTGQKQKNQSFCRNCFYRLPEEMRRSLYKRFGMGYEQAFEAAQAFLRSLDAHHQPDQLRLDK